MTEGDTFIVTSNPVVSPDYVRTFPLADMLRWLGDPLETISIHERGAAKASAATRDVAPYVPRTELGRKLWEIRKRIVAAGKATMTWEDIEREVAERRGGVGDLFE